MIVIMDSLQVFPGYLILELRILVQRKIIKKYWIAIKSK